MDSDGFWARLREARAVQGLLVYLGATWLVLQLLDLLIDNLGLPAWTMVGAISLLTIGLVIQLAVVWVQALLLARREGEGETESLPASPVATSFTWARFALGGIFAFALLFGIAGAYVLVTGPSEVRASFAADDGAAPGLAVLPFSVAGSDLEELGEGIVSLLATNLDGVAGLRAIDSRTVLARWDELVGDRPRADRETNLAVARAAGARYALLGSAVELGDSVRLQADVFDLATEGALDHRQIEGSPDNLLGLVDRLSIEVIDVILGQQPDVAQSLSVATVTTNSIPALKAYLDGEAAYQRADFEGARAAYERAIAGDSTFALAYYQLANAWGWSNGPAHPQAIENRRRAVELSDRLPIRQSLLVHATDEVFRGDLGAIERLRMAVQRYPDHAEAWYLLGDAYYHLGARSLASLDDMSEAFGRAIELDPGFAPFHIHLLDLSFPQGDSASAWSRIRRYGDLAPGSQFDERTRLQFALAFGDSVNRRVAKGRLGGLDMGELHAAASPYLNGCCWSARDAVLSEITDRAAAEGDDPHYATMVTQIAAGALMHGQLDRALELFAEPGVDEGVRACNLASYQVLGFPIPESTLEEALRIDEGVDGEGVEPLCRALYAGQKGRWRDFTNILAHYDSLAALPDSVGDGAGIDPATLALSLRGYELWKRGQAEAALPLVEQAFLAGGWGWWLGGIYEELGRHEDAARFYAAHWAFPISYHALGRVYERLGEPEKARAAYEYFVRSWNRADDSMMPWVNEAIEGILRTRDVSSP
ncbi:MAG: tetratricopeptide repeat protein [Gemmatimonadota bacterium]|nr:tetratricopeptide repeat protein [Gemmatimonadota bacterium]